MFSLSSLQSDIQTVVMVEDHQTLLAIFQYIYPISKVEVGSFSYALHLIRAADKLQFDAAVEGFRSSLEGMLKESNPFRAWAVALQYNFDDVCKDAILRIIRSKDVSNMPLVDVDELKLVTCHCT